MEFVVTVATLQEEFFKCFLQACLDLYMCTGGGIKGMVQSNCKAQQYTFMNTVYGLMC